MLKEAGAEFAIVGHSERRRMFGDTDEVVNRKTLAAYLCYSVFANKINLANITLADF